MINNTSIKKISNKYFPELHDKFMYDLILVSVVFRVFRPDRLLQYGKIFIYFPYILNLVLFFGWLKANRKYLNNTQTKFVFCFLMLMIIQVPFAKMSSWAFDNLIHFFLGTLLGYVFLIQFINTPHRVDKYIRFYVILSAFTAIMGIVNRGKLNIPILRDENDFCLVMNILLPFAFLFAKSTDDKKKKLLYYSLSFLFVFGTVSSFSRGGLVGLCSVWIYLAVVSNKKFVMIFISIVFFTMLIYLAPLGYFDEMKTILSDKITEEGTGKARLEYAKAGIKIFLKNPIIGVGAKNYGAWVADYYGWKDASKQWGRVAHSIYFTLLPEMGIIGTFLFIGILVAIYKNHKFINNMWLKTNIMLKESKIDEEEKYIISVIKNHYVLSLGCLGAVIAFLTTGAFISVFWYPYFWILTALSVIIYNPIRKLESTINDLYNEKKCVEL